MKKNLIKCLFLIIILMMTLMACVRSSNVNDVKETWREGEALRFVVIESTYGYDIAYDRYTKVMYTISRTAHSNGIFTLLVDSDGNPLLYEN